jgi:PTS system mannose-specific IIA component
MIGIVVVTHCNLGGELLRAAEFIMGKIKGVAVVSLDPTMEAERLRREVASALGQVDAGQGVLILTDMFGGTPSNISLSFLKEGRVDVVTGVNLPMLIHGTSRRSDKTLGQLAEEVQNYGRRSISQAGQLLKKEVG